MTMKALGSGIRALRSMPIAAALITVGACAGDHSVAPEVRGGSVSRIDGLALDQVRLATARAKGQLCTRGGAQGQGMLQAVALKRSDLPFEIPGVSPALTDGAAPGRLAGRLPGRRAPKREVVAADLTRRRGRPSSPRVLRSEPWSDPPPSPPRRAS